MEITRGDIFSANLDPVIGSEQGGKRPILVIQNDMGNEHSPTVIVAAITSRVYSKRKLPTHARLKCECLPKESMALMEQIRTIDKTRLGEYIGRITEEDMEQVEAALLSSLGFKEVTEDASYV